jgi:hypothetical protein
VLVRALLCARVSFCARLLRARSALSARARALLLQTSPPGSPGGDESGDGSAPSSLSHAGIRRRLGRRLPDAILHGKRSFRPRSRAVQCVAAAGLLSEAFQLASTGGCATGLRTRSRHVCELTPRLGRLAQGQPRLLVVRSPCATGLASSLSGCILLTGQRCSFSTSPTWRKVFTDPAEISCPSQRLRSLCPAVRRLSFGRSRSRGTARVTGTVLAHSSNRLPSG